MVSLEEGYNKIVPPYTTNEELLVYGKPSVEPVQVNISISLLNIVEIDEVDFSITFQFEINLEWFEYRAAFHNLKDKVYMNSRPVHKNLFLEFPKYPGRFMLHFDI